MKIEMNTIYHLPTQAHEDDFLKQADKLGLRWLITNSRADVESHWESYEDDTCIRVSIGGSLTYGAKSVYKRSSVTDIPIIEWKIGFTKADMQIGQIYKTDDGEIHQWTKDDVANLRWHNEYHYPLNSDIVEVYPLNLTPVWKRPEPKYRVKTELTKEQAEKLGLEFCEEV